MHRLLVLGAWALSMLAMLAGASGPLVSAAVAQGYSGGGPSGTSGYTTGGGTAGSSGGPGGYGATAAPIQRVELTIDDFVFFPAEISFPAGTQITWVNRGQARHTVTAAGLWDSGPIAAGGRWAAVFWTPGTYDYICTIHPDLMRGRVTITAQ